MLTDPIADMLTRIRNGLAAGKREVAMPFSKFKLRLAQILEQEKYIEGVTEADASGKPQLVLALRYAKDGKPAVQLIRRVSTPGRRVYSTKENLPVVLNGYGVAIISTPQGVLTSTEAKKRGLGGEIICEIA